MDARGTGAADGGGVGQVSRYRPRRPEASPLYPLVQDHFRTLETVYDERFARAYGPWRAVVRDVADKFLACGILDHGFARVRCATCAHEYLLAFSCKGRYFCPSCHAKRLALWTLWLEETLLAPVPHRQVVLTIPKRLRPWCLYRRALLGDLARVAARTVTAAVRTLTRERRLAVGVVACIQTHGSRANWHPHIHMLVTDGGFRADGTFVPWPVHDTAALTEAFRRAVLRLFVRRGIFDAEDAQAMLAWPHAGFHVHDPRRRRGVRQAARALLRPESRGARAPAVRRARRVGALPLGQARRANGGHRDGGPAGVPGAPRYAHPQQAPGDDPLLWLVREPAPRGAAEGGRGTGRWRTRPDRGRRA